MGVLQSGLGELCRGNRAPQTFIQLEKGALHGKGDQLPAGELWVIISGRKSHHGGINGMQRKDLVLWISPGETAAFGNADLLLKAEPTFLRGDL